MDSTDTDKFSLNNYRITHCCANCKHSKGWVDNLWCGKHDDQPVSCSAICDDYCARTISVEMI